MEQKDFFKKAKIKVIGVGTGGARIVSEIAPFFKKTKTRFLILDNHQEKAKKNVKTILLDPSSLKEEKKLKEAKESLKKTLQGTDFFILVSCLGGESGSCLLEFLVDILTKSNSLIYGIFTLPFGFEGEKKMAIAQNILSLTRNKINGFSLVPNERIFQVVEKNISLKEAFSKVNEILKQNLLSLIEIICRPALINIDFADLETIFKGRGQLVYLENIKANEPLALLEKINQLSIYPYNLKGAKKVIFQIAGPKQLSLGETKEISQKIFQLLSPYSKIIFGLLIHSLNEYQLTILGLGCEENKLESTPLLKEKKSQEKPKEKITKRKKTKTKKIKNKKKEKIKIKIQEEKPPEERKEDETKEIKVRKNGIQVQKEIKAIEEELQKSEEFWDIPAFLRKLKGQI